MAMYLNTSDGYVLYKSQVESPYFVDKTKLLLELIPLACQGNQHICITRPRRFGKTVMANMVAAYFGKGVDAGGLFDSLEIAGAEGYGENLNQFNVIAIDFSIMDDGCESYQEYIGTIKSLLREDLRAAYPDIAFRENSPVSEDLKRIFDRTGDKFLFVLDEWDAVFYAPFITEADKKSYLLFLKGLLKDKAYTALTYMTGILPIAKYSSGSELNMFLEYTMASEARFSKDFGFTEAEVDMLYGRYLSVKNTRAVTRQGLKDWYDGYDTKSGVKVYNPRSVAAALINDNLGNYWTSAGPYDEIYYYIEQNIDDVREDLLMMAAGESVPAKIREYAAASMNLATRDEIFSAMVVYGFLTYRGGRVSIPNRELMDKFSEMIQKETALGYVYRLARKSNRMLKATLEGDTRTMAEILEYAHNTETPMLSYNNETELSAVVNLVYLAARDRYRVEREDKAEIGYADFIFYPDWEGDDGIILELKIDHSPENAIQQIKDRQYALKFQGRMGEQRRFGGRILAVGISYDRKTKEHGCKIEVLRECE